MQIKNNYYKLLLWIQINNEVLRKTAMSSLLVRSTREKYWPTYEK